jgi:hypothetical protein
MTRSARAGLRVARPGLLALLSLALAAAACGKDKKEFVLDVNVVDGCIVSTACNIMKRPRVSNCLDAYYQSYIPLGEGPLWDGIYKCVNAAKGDCDLVYECYGADRHAGSCSQTYKASCKAGKAVTCDLLDHMVYTYDCASAGLGCQVQGQSCSSICIVGTCDSSYAPSCNGNYRLACSSGTIQMEDCSLKSQTCSGGECQGSAESCSSPYAPTCDGDVLVQCVSGTIEKTDCARQPSKRRCESGACVPSGSDCSGDEFDRCSGDQLQSCIDGSWVTYDCAALGLGVCTSESYGARCVEAG